MICQPLILKIPADGFLNPAVAGRALIAAACRDVNTFISYLDSLLRDG
jgi:hypothetical protein